MFERILCAIGIHGWEFTWQIWQSGFAIGLRCMRCGRWHKNATKGKREDPEDDH